MNPNPARRSGKRQHCHPQAAERMWRTPFDPRAAHISRLEYAASHSVAFVTPSALRRHSASGGCGGTKLVSFAISCGIWVEATDQISSLSISP